ncbi:response regulator [Desulfobacterales bacterium HSG2]|nr:response regulator [Desulfobacterales bacterium HSG2]
MKSPRPKNTFGITKNRILVVEAEEAIRDLLSYRISTMGYNATFACNGKEGLECFQKGAYNLVISDLTMNAMDGLTMARLIKQKSPDTPIILMTGWSREEVLPKLKENAVDFTIFKPARFRVLREAIESFLSEF